jgi:hypothetical protein
MQVEGAPWLDGSLYTPEAGAAKWQWNKIEICSQQILARLLSSVIVISCMLYFHQYFVKLVYSTRGIA